MTSIYIEYCKSNNGYGYLALKADLGYKVVTLTYDKDTIYEISPVPISELYTDGYGIKAVIV